MGSNNSEDKDPAVPHCVADEASDDAISACTEAGNPATGVHLPCWGWRLSSEQCGLWSTTDAAYKCSLKGKNEDTKRNGKAPANASLAAVAPHGPFTEAHHYGGMR